MLPRFLGMMKTLRPVFSVPDVPLDVAAGLEAALVAGLDEVLAGVVADDELELELQAARPTATGRARASSVARLSLIPLYPFNSVVDRIVVAFFGAFSRLT